jgi:hypothetical protein
MSSVDREGSRDRELVLKHQSSVSDSGRSSVPMYESFLVFLTQLSLFLHSEAWEELEYNEANLSTLQNQVG